MSADPGQRSVTAFERWSVLLTTAGTVLTGLVYLWMKYALDPADPLAVVNHPLQPVVLKLHILVAPLLIFALGLITVRHVWRHYRLRIPAGRKSGLLTALVSAPMILSGYLIQAVTSPGWLRALAWLHLATGVLFALGFLVHWWLVIRKATQ